MSNKYENCEMIKAVAEDKSLVVFIKHNNHNSWCALKHYGFPDLTGTHKYFLCLPQHKEACLHWLNGGDCQQSPVESNQWVTTGSNRKWGSFHSFMQEELRFRIKPKKEKRWIAVLPNGRVSGWHDETTDQLREQYNKDAGWQFIKIEVEV